MRQLLRAGLLFLAAVPLGAATFTVTTSSDSGAGSLRQAILDANANPGADTIAFAIPGPGVHTLALATGLPTITDPVLIDGYTQPGSSPNTNGPGLPDNAVILVELDGSGATPGSNAFSLTAGGSGSTLQGFVINGWISDDNGNGGHAFFLNGASTCTIAGNFAGTNAAGTAAVPNGGMAIFAFNSSADNVFGGTTPGSRNVLSGNFHGGIIVGNAGATGNRIQGNFIGINAAGTAPIFNSPSGISLNFTGVGNNVIGGSTPEERNVVSGNLGVGINLLYASENVVQGNFIGTDLTGSLPIPNNQGGVNIADGFLDSSNNTLGGSAPGSGNVIAFNHGPGVTIAALLGHDNVGNVIRGNSIFENTGPGIDLGGDGVTPNDAGDGDTGQNAFQNFPIVSSAAPAGGGTQVQGVLHGAPSASFRLDFYSNPSCIQHPHDFLQGRTFLGSLMVSTDVGGAGPFDDVVSVAIAAGEQVTATATDSAGNTSEFSQRLPFSVSPASGPSAGGTDVTIAGTDFQPDAAVTIGGVAATNVVVSDFNGIMATTPALAPGTVNDIAVVNGDGSSGTLRNGFVSDFLDVPPAHPFYAFVSPLVANAITAGIGNGLYGVDLSTLRRQMAVFLLKGKHGLCYTPPPCTGTFPDVTCPSAFADWIEALAAEGITGGCGGGNYCPANPVRRDQMAAFLLKAKHGSSYVPPACAGVFGDVPCPSQFADWIEELAAENITGGCGGGNYCPLTNNTRGQMAVFIDKTFGLQ